MKYLIQVDKNNIPYHDFGFSLLQSCDYLKWFYGEGSDIYEEEAFSYLLCKDSEIESYEFSSDLLLRDCVPVGDLDFVFRYIEHEGKSYKKPINIPERFLLYKKKDFIKRNAFTLKNATLSDVYYTAEHEFKREDKFFLKKIDKYKSLSVVVDEVREIKNFSVNWGDYFLSEYKEFAAEFRCFILNKEIVDIRRYAGDFSLSPDIGFVKEVIESFSRIEKYSDLLAYTIDVAVTNGDFSTCLVEIHPFVSCGLYGFDNKKLLPTMLTAGYNWLVKEN